MGPAHEDQTAGRTTAPESLPTIATDIAAVQETRSHLHDMVASPCSPAIQVIAGFELLTKADASTILHQQVWLMHCFQGWFYIVGAVSSFSRMTPLWICSCKEASAFLPLGGIFYLDQEWYENCSFQPGGNDLRVFFVLRHCQHAELMGHGVASLVCLLLVAAFRVYAKDSPLLTHKRTAMPIPPLSRFH